MVNLLFFDIDGTLTDIETGKMPRLTAESIEEAKKAGHICFINSGRPFATIQKHFVNLMDGVVCGLGTNIYYNDIEVFYASLDKEICLQIQEASLKFNVECVFEGKNGVFFHEHMRTHFSKSIHDIYVNLKCAVKYYPSSHILFEKFCVHYDGNEDLEGFDRIALQHFRKIDRGDFYEYERIGYSKATGIDYLCEYFHTDLEHCYVFGDSTNDLSMLTHVKHSVAMENGMDEIKSKVEYVTTNSKDDGIYNALVHYKLIEPRNPILLEMEEYAKTHSIPIMLEDGLDFMLNFIKKHRVKRILEIGSAIGYSAIRMALLDKDIHIDTIERDDIRYQEAVKNIKAMHLENQIHIVYGDAFDVMFEKEDYDLIFIDAAKAQYIKFFERFSSCLKHNGYIISDNLSFHGIVENPNLTSSRNTKQLVRKISEYIAYLENNKQFKTTFYDIGDRIGISEYNDISFDGYIFDMDGLLIDSEKVARECWLSVANRRGFDLPWSIYSKFLGHSYNDIKIIFENEVETKDNFAVVCEDVYKTRDEYYETNTIEAKMGIKELLESLHSKNKRLVVATSNFQEKAKELLTKAGIISYFDEIISGDMVKHSKPNPEIFEIAMNHLQLPKQACVVIEDSLSGIEAAMRAGCRSIMIPDLVEPDDNAKKWAYKIVKSASDLI